MERVHGVSRSSNDAEEEEDASVISSLSRMNEYCTQGGLHSQSMQLWNKNCDQRYMQQVAHEYANVQDLPKNKLQWANQF